MPTTTMVWEAAQSGADPAARDALLLEHIRLVKHVVAQVMRMTSGDAEFDDLVSAGTIGLMNAVDNFDPSRGLAFSTFAAPRIRGSVLDDLRRRDHVPRSVRKKQRDLSRAREKLSRSLGRAPSGEEMASELDVDTATLWRWERTVEQADQVSLDRQVDTGGGQSTGVQEFISASDGPTVEDRINQREEVEILRDEIMALKEQERVVLSLYYFEELKLHEIASMLGVTESRISQIRSKAIANLRGRLMYLRDEPK